MHIHDLAAATALSQRLECAKDALRRLGDPDAILRRHNDNDVQVSVMVPVLLDTNGHEPQYAQALFPLPAEFILDTIASCRVRLKADIETMEVELRNLGITMMAVN